jgi:hypothetical protein
MVTATATVARRALLLAALLAVLFIGLVGMHHLSTPTTGAPHHDVAAASSPVAASTTFAHSAPDPAPERPHEEHAPSLLHLCLAVLTSIAAVAAVLVAWRPWDTVVRRASTSHTGRPRTVPRAPPPSAPARLALLCVLRT